MTIYEELQEIGKEILTQFDQSTVYLVQKISGTGPVYNPGESTEIVTKLQAVVKGISYKYAQTGFNVETDKEIIAAVITGITPSKNDYIRVDGIDLKIVEDISSPAASTRAVWKFIVRKVG